MSTASGKSETEVIKKILGFYQLRLEFIDQYRGKNVLSFYYALNIRYPFFQLVQICQNIKIVAQ